MKASRFDASEESDACSSIEPVAGLSHTQVPIWVGQQLDPDSPLYNMAFTFVVDGEIDVARFKRAWRRIVDSNSILRTSFRDEDGRGIPFVLPPGSCEIETIDLSDRDDPRQSFRDLAGERAATTLPLDGELVDAVLARLRPSRFGFYLNQHHLITDAASTELLLRRLSEEYLDRSSCNVDEATGPEPYEVTIERLATYAPEAHRQEASQHWLDLQSGPDRSTPFYGRSIEPRSTRNTRRTLELDTNQSDRLREISRDPGFLSLTPEISLFAVFSTLLTAWLHRISGRRQLGFDAPVHNRPTSAAKNSLGLFIEMFPFAVDVEEGASFRSLGEKCLAEAQRFLRAALPATSSTSKVGSNNVVLNFFPGQLGGFAGMPTRVEWIHPGHADKHHGLRLQAHDFEGSGRFTLQFDANDEVFDAAPHIRSVEYFTKLLDAFLDDPDQTIAGVEILTEAERSAMLTEFNRTDSEPLPRLTVSEMIRLQADRTPDRIALRQRNRELRYGELDRAVEARAAELVALGLSPGNRVAVFMTRSIEAVVAILAILRAGGIYVPIDSKFPEARVRQIVADSDASLVLVTGDRVSKLDTLDAQAVVLGIDGIAGATEPGPEPTMPSTLDLAYLIYTSGSTGKPKGVPVSHGGLADYLEWASRQYVRNDELVFPLFTSLAFDLTVTSLYLPLITGGTLVIYEEPDGPVDTSLIDMVGENAVDFVKLTPSHLSLLREMDLADSRIGRMVVGGEDFRTSLAAKIYQQFDGKIEIYNEYGPTEAVVGCMIHRFDPSVDRDSRVPIGRPAEHVQIFLLNEERTPVPEGVPAELCISRYGLSQGYWNRESLTRRQFVDHPFASTGRLYRTGDRARFARPGSLEYLGRIDRQLKVSGFRVEPSEIESALRAHPEIDDCVVTGWSLRAAESHWARHPDYCRRCGLPSNYPGVEFDSRGVCGICISYEAIKDRADAYFRDLDALTEIFEQSAAHHDAPYDCMMLLSGGKDSTYALCRLVDMGLKVYAFSFDNGYISEQAIANVKRVVESLGVDHEIATTPAMNEIFRDSLIRFSNVCNGCFKTIYTLSLTRAHEMGIPIVVTGLSRGQFFETRLAEGSVSRGCLESGRCRSGRSRSPQGLSSTGGSGVEIARRRSVSERSDLRGDPGGRFLSLL